jgi:collagen type III alpha
MAAPFELWGQRDWFRQEVAGESHYADAIERLFETPPSSEWQELRRVAELVPDPKNKYDRNAVQVRINGAVVGHLPKEDAARYVAVLSALTAQGWLPQVAATVRGGLMTDYDYDRRGRPVERRTFVGSVTLDVAEPHLLVPVNLPPDAPHTLLPAGGAIQVTGEEAYLSTLAPLVGDAGECWIYTTLHEVTEQLVRSVRTLVEVRVDGSPAGRLTPKMSSELLPAVRHLAEQGVVTAARALLKGNRIKADVVLYVARAGELSAQWLSNPPIAGTSQPASPSGATIAEPAAAGPVPATTWRFNPPPGWPQPPPGWTPPEGWAIPANLPPAPPGWQWWVPADV